jgi:glutathione S-transferase
MDLYFSPLACSMATRIALYEAGHQANFIEVDPKTKKVQNDGSNFLDVNPLGLVPALRTDDGEVLIENAAILQYLADRRPESGLAPQGFARYRLQQWLSFISSELHKPVFTPLLSANFPDEAKAKAREMAPARFAILEAHLTGRDWLLDDFSIADAYLAAILNWNQVTRFDLSAYPAIQAYQARLATRPAVTKAVQEEFALYQAA